MIAMSGSVESCDCLVTLYKNSGVSVEISSDVIIQYGKQIENVIKNVLNENNLENIKVVVEDKGALDYTLRARLITALKRGGLI